MPKAKLVFDLDDPFEKEAHLRAVKATDAYLALYSFREEVFKKIRTVDDEDSTESEVLKWVIDKLTEELEHYSIDLNNELS